MQISPRRLDRQAGFADPALPNKADQPVGRRGQTLGQLRQLGLTAKERGQGFGQIVPVARRRCGVPLGGSNQGLVSDLLRRLSQLSIRLHS